MAENKRERIKAPVRRETPVQLKKRIKAESAAGRAVRAAQSVDVPEVPAEAKKAPAKAPAKKTAARKTAAKKTTPAKKAASSK